MNNLYKKILKLQLEIGSTPKNGFNTHGNYKYWLLSDIFNKLKVLCRELNILILHSDNSENMEWQHFLGLFFGRHLFLIFDRS
ncbi:ERF family protein [Spiroplasma endosymbiont of Dactylopius coccus]